MLNFLVTRLDNESNYSMKKAILCYKIDGADVCRCLSKDLSTFLHPNGPLCKLLSPFLPVLCEKVLFRTEFRLNLNWSHMG